MDPTLILRVQMAGDFQELGWEQLGLTVLSTDADRTLLLFASNDDLQEFRTRLDLFSQGPLEGQKGPQYASFIGGIERIGPVDPSDRIGPKLKAEGFNAPGDFAMGEIYIIDLEIWDLGDRLRREYWIENLSNSIDELGGEVLDRYFGPSITMLRARCYGNALATLLNIEVVASIDLPPQPDLGADDILRLARSDVPIPERISEDAPIIGVIDSGMNLHPLLENLLVGSIAVPDELGTADEWGHGTRVGGIAVFGDLRGQLEAGVLRPFARVCSARVVNERGFFDDRRLTPSVMREAITRLHREFGCRVFVSALADRNQVYDGGKVGPWAATLDELVRELDVVIIVAAGNGSPAVGGEFERAVTDYPGYLLDASNRLFEPAGALNVITVGALAHGPGLGPTEADDLWARPITEAAQPSPFTRVGPGVGVSQKPDVVDDGGTAVYDAASQRLRDGRTLAHAGVLTLNHRFLDSFFTSRSGTSYAAPLVAAKAAQILTRFPEISANLVRALLVGAAALPEPAETLLSPLGNEALVKICGHGRIDLERAAFSDDHRVVLVADAELAVDEFVIYEIPMIDAFKAKGRRTIQITLAYDPPVRHTRKDYAGIGMSFRLHRGGDPSRLYEFYRRRNIKQEGRQENLSNAFKCILPGSQERERSSIQVARKHFTQATNGHGDAWHLVVRCEAGWKTEGHQRYALVVELAHEEPIRLYELLRARVTA